MPEHDYEERPKVENEESISRLMAVRRVNITPSRIEFTFPTYSVPNRVIRTYFKYKENFLRVSFLTESRNRSSFYGDDDTLLRQIRIIMRDGFKIGKKHFKFLHYSNSQLRSHS